MKEEGQCVEFDPETGFRIDEPSRFTRWHAIAFFGTLAVWIVVGLVAMR